MPEANFDCQGAFQISNFLNQRGTELQPTNAAGPWHSFSYKTLRWLQVAFLFSTENKGGGKSK